MPSSPTPRASPSSDKLPTPAETSTRPSRFCRPAARCAARLPVGDGRDHRTAGPGQGGPRARQEGLSPSRPGIHRPGRYWADLVRRVGTGGESPPWPNSKVRRPRVAVRGLKESPVSQATLTINSRNYGAWSLRGWLLCKFAGLDFTVEVVDSHDPDARAELLLLSPSFLVPRLQPRRPGGLGHPGHGRVPPRAAPDRALLPDGPAGQGPLPVGVGRDPLRLRQPALGPPDEHQGPPPGLPGLGRGPGRHRPHRDDLERVPGRLRAARTCSASTRTVADAMYAPVCTRLRTYDVKLGAVASDYIETILAMPEMVEWTSRGPARARRRRRTRDGVLTGGSRPAYLSRWPG